ncbi:MAG: GNAT family N-acetyltransferase [Ruminococcaceae bacterium]|nr:GNAT family N-acetyltransferase [Oscillospiraceae bacterium]
MEYKITKINEQSEIKETAALWFSGKFGVPVEAYLESMDEDIENKNKIPKWYVVLNSIGEIIAGAGVIENDFHKRKDLRPNICAVYTEENYRKKGIMKKLLNFICNDIKALGEKEVYLLTDHTEFYEKCGFDYFTQVEEDGGTESRCYKRIL